MREFIISAPEKGEGWFRLIPAMDWIGISAGSRAGVDLLAKRKIPAPPLKVLIFSQ